MFVDTKEVIGIRKIGKKTENKKIRLYNRVGLLWEWLYKRRTIVITLV
jgi:hypothetical protein